MDIERAGQAGAAAAGAVGMRFTLMVVNICHECKTTGPTEEKIDAIALLTTCGVNPEFVELPRTGLSVLSLCSQ